MRSFLLVLVLVVTAHADVVDDVIAAHKAGKSLKQLAEKDKPDPWIVADDLCARGEFDAAEAFARAAPRVDTENLPAYVAARRKKPDDPKRRARIAAASAALKAGGPADALKALGLREDPIHEDVVGARLACLRAIALSRLTRLDDSMATWLVAARCAERLGWLTRAAGAYDTAGRIAYDRAKFQFALSIWQRWLRICERRSARADAASALGNLGLAHFSLGNLATALSVLKRALIEMNAIGDESGAARTLMNIGNIYTATAQYERALATLRQAQATFEKLENKAESARAHANIGIVYLNQRDLRRAQASLGQALALQRELGDRPGAARTLGNLGGVQLARGDYPQALATLTSAASAMNALGDRWGAALMLHNIGLAQRHLGRYAQALSTAERALAEFEAFGNASQAAAAIGSSAAVYFRLGNYAKALLLWQRVLAVEQKLGLRASAATTQANIGLAHRFVGNYAKALAMYKLALQTRTELGDVIGVADVQVNMGDVYLQLRDYTRALTHWNRALTTYKSMGTKANAAVALGNIGNVHTARGNHAEALSTYERALATFERLGNNAASASTLSNIAATRATQGDWAGAVQAARRSVRLLPLLVGGLGDEQGASARDHWSKAMDVGVRAAVGLESPDDVLFFLESGRASSLLEALGNRNRISNFVIPPALDAATAKARDRERVALHHYRRALDKSDDVQELWKEVEAARAGILDVVQRIQREAKAEADLVYPKPSSLAQAQATLHRGDAMVHYALLKEKSIALVLTTKDARIVKLGATEEITKAAEALQRAMARPNTRSLNVAPHESFDYLAKRLHKLVVAPLKLKAKRVLVSPDGLLCYVPFAALTDAEVAYVPSATTYGLLRDDLKKRGKKVLALGNPDYTVKRDPTEVSLYAGGKLEPLPASGKEAQAVGDVVLLGKDATLDGLREALGKQERWHAVHLACHGLIDPQRPVLSSLALTKDFLRCLDVYRMKIPADLVVLSACETAKGKLYKTEGVIGWTRAFMFAGSPRVLVSLWKVDDEATRVLMEKFYKEWKSADAATALAAAQAHVRSHPKWKHPHFWAAWQLWGLAE